jgi:hypothetical protein
MYLHEVFSFSSVFVQNAQLLMLLHIQREGRVGLRVVKQCLSCPTLKWQVELKCLPLRKDVQ